MPHPQNDNLAMSPEFAANNNGQTDMAKNLQEDTYLFAFLELRYGAGYAQKLLDDLRRFERKANAACA